MAGCPNLRTACPGRALAGRKLASGFFGRCRRTCVRRTPRKSLNSRRVARPAATKTASGVRYYGHRYYSPTLGRFINRDPAEESSGLNIYAFVHNAPVGFIDTDGRGEQSANQQTAPTSAAPVLSPSGNGRSQWRDPSTGQFAKPPSLPPPPPGNRIVPEPETFDSVNPPSNPASAAAAAADLTSNLLTASQLSVFLNKGKRDCAAQMQATGGKCACCVIRNYRLTRISVWGNRVYYVYGFGTAVNSPCSKIKEDWLNRDEINPYYGNGKSLIQTSVTDFLDW